MLKWLMSGLVLAGLPAAASDLDEFKVKRQEVFEFAEKPQITRSGDRTEIRFEAKGFCDVTVAVEVQEKIVRHLASGVLGAQAPEPFQKNSLKQLLVWDGKDDQGKYLDQKNSLVVRVALGLKPQFERSLFWDPRKRLARTPPLVAAAPEGVYVYEGLGLEQVRLFDHAGNYARTVYPFPAEKIGQVDAVEWQVYPQDGQKVPQRKGKYLNTFLTSGPSGTPYKAYGPWGTAATALAASVTGERLALAQLSLNRLCADGSTGGLPLAGARTSITHDLLTFVSSDRPKDEAGPRSAAFSPDGKWLYFSGYCYDKNQNDIRWGSGWHGLHGVYRMAYAENAEPKLFAGGMRLEDAGTEPGRFRFATSVDCDAQGRVYVSDYLNDRIQVFDAGGKFIQAIPTARPAQIAVHRKTGELYVFSWFMPNQFELLANLNSVKPAFTRLGPLDNPKALTTCPLPIETTYEGRDIKGPQGLKWMGCDTWRAALDSWTEPPMIWLVPGAPSSLESWTHVGIRLAVEKGGKLEVVKDFAKEAKAAVVRLNPPHFSRQRLFVNPAGGKLYLAEQEEGFCLEELSAIDPESGKVSLLPLPYSTEDVAFDSAGLIYLRGDAEVGRFDPQTWREVPWDYGEEREKAGYVGDGSHRALPLLSGLPIATGNWHKGGMSVSPRGHLAVTCYYPSADTGEGGESKLAYAAKGYAPRLYPGRQIMGKAPIIHIWDSHGKMIVEDAVPGLGVMRSIGLDKDDALYLFGGGFRVLDGKPYPHSGTTTLMKFLPKKGRILSAARRVPVPIPENDMPKAAPQIIGLSKDGMSPAWVEGAEWLYGGLGIEPHQIYQGCSCFDSRCAQDYFGRSFAPETDHYSVAVLDTNGNLVLRLGRYGNVDDGKPLEAATAAPQARALGGDEVALFFAPQVATHTDRRLFIADIGNARIVSVKLGYHAEERVALKDVRDTAR